MDRCRNSDGQKEALGVEINFSGLVNHADLPLLDRHFFMEGDIDHLLIKGDGVPFVRDADQKSGRRSFWLLHDELREVV